MVITRGNHEIIIMLAAEHYRDVGIITSSTLGATNVSSDSSIS